MIHIKQESLLVRINRKHSHKYLIRGRYDNSDDIYSMLSNIHATVRLKQHPKKIDRYLVRIVRGIRKLSTINRIMYKHAKNRRL